MELAFIETLSACTAFTLGSEAFLESDRVRSILSRHIVGQTLDIGWQVFQGQDVVGVGLVVGEEATVHVHCAACVVAVRTCVVRLGPAALWGAPDPFGRQSSCLVEGHAVPCVGDVSACRRPLHGGEGGDPGVFGHCCSSE